MFDRDTLSIFGSQMRRLIPDFVEELGADIYIGGFCFQIGGVEKPRLVFSESHLEEKYYDSIDAQDISYYVNADDPLVQSIERNLDRDGKLPDLSVSDENSVRKPIRTVFGDEVLSPGGALRVSTVALGPPRQVRGRDLEGAKAAGTRQGNNCIFYVIYKATTRESTGASVVQKADCLRATRFMLANLVKQAISFAHAACKTEEANELRIALEESLMDKLERFSSLQADYVMSALHPVSGQFLTSAQSIHTELVDFSDDHEIRLAQAVNAMKITRKGRLAGSLGGKVVLSVEIVPPADFGSTGARLASTAPGYPAVIKDDARIDALKTQLGLSKLWGYHEHLGGLLPQLPVFFPYNTSDGREVRFASVSPLVREGKSLFEFAEEWHSRDDRVEAFSHICGRLSEFLRGIRADRTTEQLKRPQDIIFESMFGNIGRAPRRRQKLDEVIWPNTLAEGPMLIGLSMDESDITIVNPAWFAANKPSPDDEVWQSGYEEVDQTVTFSHGDFHVGNVLICSADSPPRVVVIDFDQVGAGDSMYHDIATMEMSLLLSIVTYQYKPGEESRGNRLHEEVVPGLFVLWKPDLYHSVHQNNRFAFDLYKVLTRLNGHRITDSLSRFHHACRAVALLRLITSYSRIARDQKVLSDFAPTLMTGTVLLGLTLSSLIYSNQEPQSKVTVAELIDEGWPE